jgi:hypothetical protein
VVAKAEPSPAAQRKAARKRTEPADGEPLPVLNSPFGVALVAIWEVERATGRWRMYHVDLTFEIKRKILGENTARLYGIDIAAQTAKLSRDGIGLGR